MAPDLKILPVRGVMLVKSPCQQKIHDVCQVQSEKCHDDLIMIHRNWWISIPNLNQFTIFSLIFTIGIRFESHPKSCESHNPMNLHDISPNEKSSIFSGEKRKKCRPRAKSWPKELSKNRCDWAWEVFHSHGGTPIAAWFILENPIYSGNYL